MTSHNALSNDGDTDLSFEALTFGEDSGHIKKENKPKKKVFNKDRQNGQQESSEKDKSASSVYVSTRGEAERIDVPALLKRLEQFGVVKAYYFKEKQNFGFIQFLDPSVIDGVIENLNKCPLQFNEGTVQIIAERAGGRGGNNASALQQESPQSYVGSFGGSFGGTSFGTSFPFSPSTPTTTATPTISVSANPSSSASGLSSLTSPNPAASITSPSPSPAAPVPEKPDTILVLKNLPFSLKQDQLQEILMAMNTTAPQSINLHFDNMGVFRGMAFIKYRLLDDAIKVYEALNGYDVGGRKVRVEYKRKNKGQQADVPQEWLDEEDLRKLWEQVRDFSNNPNVNEISFTPNLSSNQRKHIHTMAEKLKLTHYSNGEGDLRYICIKKPSPSSAASPLFSSSSSSSTTTTSNLSSGQGHHGHGHGQSVLLSPNGNTGGSGTGISQPIPSSYSPNGDTRGTPIDIKGRRPRRDSDSSSSTRIGVSPSNGIGNGSGNGNGNGNGFGNGNGNGIGIGNGIGNGMSGSIDKTEYRPRGASYKQKDVASSAPADINMDWRTQGTPSSSQFQIPISTLSQSPSISISSSAGGTPAGAGVTIAPTRQPKGPDGSKGFSDLYRNGRKHASTLQHILSSENPSSLSVLEIPVVV